MKIFRYIIAIPSFIIAFTFLSIAVENDLSDQVNLYIMAAFFFLLGYIYVPKKKPRSNK